MLIVKQWGALIKRAEIIPNKPDPVDTGMWRVLKNSVCFPHCICFYEFKNVMKIAVNLKQIEISTKTSIAILWQETGLPTLTGIAVALNNQIVKRDHWKIFALPEMTTF